MRLSNAGLDLIKQSEGFRAATYHDSANRPTIGYGHKLRPGESFPNGVTRAQAEQLLIADVATACGAVEHLVHVPLTQGQYDALVDFCFNVGGGRLASSRLLCDLNVGDYGAARHQLLLWDHAGGHAMPALQSRRQAEFTLWGGAEPESQTASNPRTASPEIRNSTIGSPV
ncbi:MAG: lysozyme [Terracidiphilus sp.]